MIRSLDETIEAFFSGEAPPGSLLAEAHIDFSAPSHEWRSRLATGLTLNCYLYDVRENADLRRTEPYVALNAERDRAVRRRPPARIDCRYCITAWSVAAEEFNPVLAEHSLLSDVLRLLLEYQRIPARYWRGSVAQQLPPYPSVVAEPDALKSQTDFWVAFNQQPRPSLTYLVTLALAIDMSEPVTPVVGSGDGDVRINLHQTGERVDEGRRAP